MRCTEFQALVGAYVLDAVTPEERRSAEEHLAHCATCRRMVAELRPVLDRLASSVPQLEPSPELKERMLSAIQGRATPPAHPRERETLSHHQRRRPGWRPSWAHLLAALDMLLLLLLSALGGFHLAQYQQLAAVEHTIASLTPTTYTLRGTSPASTVTGQLFSYPQQQISVLVMHGLPPLEGVHVYQGWLLRGKQPTSMGVLNSKHNVATVDFPGSISGFDTVAVSLEPGPRESVPAPKGAIVAMGRLSQPAPPTSYLIKG